MHKILKEANFYNELRKWERSNKIHLNQKQLDKLETIYLSIVIYNRDMKAKEYFKTHTDELLEIINGKEVNK